MPATPAVTAAAARMASEHTIPPSTRLCRDHVEPLPTQPLRFQTPAGDGLTNHRARDERQHVLPTPRCRRIVIAADVSMMAVHVVGLECRVEREREQRPCPDERERARDVRVSSCATVTPASA